MVVFASLAGSMFEKQSRELVANSNAVDPGVRCKL